jgi:two-component system OmpR family sensor kinase
MPAGADVVVAPAHPRHGLPLRTRITLASVVAMALILTTLGVFLYSRLAAELTRAVDIGLRSRAGTIAAGIGQHGLSFSDAPDIGGDTIAQILSPTGAVVETSGPTAALLATSDLAGITGPSFLDRQVGTSGATERVYVLPTNEGSPMYVVVAATMDRARGVLAGFLRLLVLGGLAALALASGAAWFLTGAALRPIDRMRAEAAAISVSEPTRRLPVPDTNDEVARLGITLNSMLDRLQEALDAERRLLDDASHELRTPLAILKAELDLARSRARTPEELEAALASASEDADHVARLAEDLLVLSRAKQGRLEIRRETVGLEALVERVCAAHRPAADALGCHIACEAGCVPVNVDPMRVRQALDNLINNALHYSPRGSTIEIRADVREATVAIVVDDSGPGFDPSTVEAVLDPFVRNDRGAAHPHEGAGLGLAIVRAVAEAHGGTASVSNRADGGGRVTMTLRVPAT